MPITFRLHTDYLRDPNDVYFINSQLNIGDGSEKYYPFTSLPMLGYMIGFMFTSENSGLNWLNDNQSGSIDIAFACMTAMAVEFYAAGKNTWQVGAEIAKDGQPFHYLDMPSKNCHGQKPGEGCDIDKVDQFDDHNSRSRFYSSGLFNRAFYLLATSNGWNTHKAYDVFVKANREYWETHTTFTFAACGALSAARDLNYNINDVKKAFSNVGIDTEYCFES
jgi:Zn-dependent metalloprotease